MWLKFQVNDLFLDAQSKGRITRNMKTQDNTNSVKVNNGTPNGTEDSEVDKVLDKKLTNMVLWMTNESKEDTNK